jgi:HEPN domain-containing protein
MVESKISVLMRISKANMAKAEKRFDELEFDSAVFHASMAIETAANAMILRLGGSEARNHRAISGLASVLRQVNPELLQKFEYRQLIEKGSDIQREVVYTRYPISTGGKWVTPMEYYTREKAQTVIENAKLVCGIIEKYLQENQLI